MVCWAGSPRWDNFFHVFMWERLSQKVINNCNNDLKSSEAAAVVYHAFKQTSSSRQLAY